MPVLSMPTWVTPCSARQARSFRRLCGVALHGRISFRGLHPGGPTRTQHTTLAWCTSRPAQRSTRGSIAITRGQEGGHSLRRRRRQTLLLGRAGIGGDKGGSLKAARIDLLGGIMSPRIFRPPSDRLWQKWTAATLAQDEAPHFLPMMVRARARRICWRNHGKATIASHTLHY